MSEEEELRDERESKQEPPGQSTSSANEMSRVLTEPFDEPLKDATKAAGSSGAMWSDLFVFGQKEFF